VSSAYINLSSGPVDMCNGWYAFDNAESRPKVFKPLPGTVAAENAKLVVIFSGMSVLPDAPEAYLAKPDLFDFIKSLPTSFDEYKVLGGDIESYISVARRSGNDWYIGSLTTREARKITLKLDFLDSGAKYTAYLFEDSPDTHFIHNREAYSTRTLQVDSSTDLTIKLAPGGGNAVRIEKL
jgi:alpha-glucosidase